MTKLTVSTKIYAPLATVRERMRNPDYIVKRAFADETTRHCPWARGSEPKVGETFTTRMEARDGSFGFDMTGQYTAVNPLESFSYTMGSYERDTDFIDAGRVVDVTFESFLLEKGGGEGNETEDLSEILVTETFDAEDINDLDMQTAGRQAILENFKKCCEEK